MPASAFRTTTFRLLAAYLALFLVLAVALAWLLMRETGALVTEETVGALRAESALLRQEAEAGGATALAEAIEMRLKSGGPGLYHLAGPDGRRIAGNLPSAPEEVVRAAPSGAVFRHEGVLRRPDGSRLGVGLSLELPGGGRLVVGRDVEEQRRLVSRLQRSFLLGFGVLALVGLLGGLAMSRAVLSRINEMSRTSRAIMMGDLSRRIARGDTRDELDELAASLNAMLERIEQLMHGLREVSDNIAHDLKTPLNRLRVRAETALRDPRGEAAYRDGLERTIEQADELMKTFNALLLIARLEAGPLEESLERFDLAALVRDMGELYEPVAEEAGLALRVTTGATMSVRANKQLIGQALTNLIENAIKYSAATAKERGRPEIDLQLAAIPDGLAVSVADRGPGIPAIDRERALKRFVRLEASRTKPGTGLGLSLVAAVARLHGGSVRLEDNGPGLRVVLHLPQRVINGNG